MKVLFVISITEHKTATITILQQSSEGRHFLVFIVHISRLISKDKTEVKGIFEFILKEIKNSPDRIIKAKYPDVFEVFEKNFLIVM